MFLEGILKRYDQGIRSLSRRRHYRILLFGYTGETLIPNVRRKGTMLCLSHHLSGLRKLYVFGNSKIDDGF